MTCVRQTSVYEGSCRTRTKSRIRQHATSRNGLAIRTRPTAPPKACAWDRAATTSQNDPIRDERPRGRTWRGATCCAASSGVYSCARRISREKHQHRAHDSLGRNLTGTKAESGTKPIRVLPYLETPGTTKRAPIELGGGGVATGRGAQLGAPHTSAP